MTEQTKADAAQLRMLELLDSDSPYFERARIRGRQRGARMLGWQCGAEQKEANEAYDALCAADDRPRRGPSGAEDG